MRVEPKFMIDLYNEAIDQWLEDSPLTYVQEMSLKYGGETLEERLRTDLQRLEYWRNKLEEMSND